MSTDKYSFPMILLQCDEEVKENHLNKPNILIVHRTALWSGPFRK